jgi:hypothetical protein
MSLIEKIKHTDIVAMVSLKGGVGKTNTSWQVIPSILSLHNIGFQIWEIDDNNKSFYYINSEIVTVSNCQTVRTDNEEIAADIALETLVSGQKLVVDGGGGNDTRAAVKLIKAVGSDVSKIWLIPIDSNSDDFKLAEETAELIDDADNTYFLLNNYILEKQFKWFNKKKLNHLEIPNSELYAYARGEQQTVYDLAQISKNMDKSEAKKIFVEQFTENGELDREAFKKAFNDFLKSELANEYLKLLNQNFERP